MGHNGYKCSRLAPRTNAVGKPRMLLFGCSASASPHTGVGTGELCPVCAGGSAAMAHLLSAGCVTGSPPRLRAQLQLPQGSAGTGHSHLMTRVIPVGRPPGNIFQPQERRNQTLWKAAQRDPKGRSSRATWQVGGHLRNRGFQDTLTYTVH